jgi:hypothetical protein
MAVSTSIRESVPSSARRAKAMNVLVKPPSSRFCRMPCSRANVAASVKQRLLNRAREQKEDFNLLLTKYGLERGSHR